MNTQMTEGMVARPYDNFLADHQGKWFHSDDEESFGGEGYETKERAIEEGSRLYFQDPETTQFYVCQANVASIGDLLPESFMEDLHENAGECGGDRFDVGELDPIQMMTLSTIIQDYLLTIKPKCLNFFQATQTETIPLRKLS